METYETYTNQKGGISYKAEIIGGDTALKNIQTYKRMIKAGLYKNIQIIPCNSCIGCKLQNAADKATQCMLEKLNPIYKDNECWFLTFTYDDAHIPQATFTDEDGVIYKSTSVDKNDLQKFWKRIRKGTKERAPAKNLMYINCNEYGKTTFRPHAHAIVWGFPLDRTKFIHRGNNEQGDAIYQSAELDELWGLGAVIIGEITFQSISYVARYTMKKVTNGIDSWYYEAQGKRKENLSQSQKIGRWYYDLHKHEIYETDTVPIKDAKGNLRKPPRAFDRLYKAEYPTEWEKVAERREKAKITALIAREEQTDLKGRKYLEVLAEKQKNFKDLRGDPQERNFI